MNAPLPPTAVEFTRRWRRQIGVTLLLIVPLVLADAAEEWLPGDMDYLLVLPTALLTIAAYVLFFNRNWRCPSCGESPSDHWRPRFCGHCGAQLLALPERAPGAPWEDPREAWRREEATVSRNAEILQRSKMATLGTSLLVCATLLAWVVPLTRPDPTQLGNVRLGALICLALGTLILVWFRRSLVAMGLPAAEIRQRMGGQVFGGGVTLILIGVAGLVWLALSFPSDLTLLLGLDPTPPAHPRLLALTLLAFPVAGLAVAVGGWRWQRKPPDA